VIGVEDHAQMCCRAAATCYAFEVVSLENSETQPRADLSLVGLATSDKRLCSPRIGDHVLHLRRFIGFVV